MELELSEQQKEVLRNEQGRPVIVLDDAAQTKYVILPAAALQSVQALLGVDQFDPDEWLPLAHEAFLEAWDAPGMEAYDDYDAHRDST